MALWPPAHNKIPKPLLTSGLPGAYPSHTPPYHHSETFKGLTTRRLELQYNPLLTLTAGSFSGIDVISEWLYTYVCRHVNTCLPKPPRPMFPPMSCLTHLRPGRAWFCHRHTNDAMTVLPSNLFLPNPPNTLYELKLRSDVDQTVQTNALSDVTVSIFDMEDYDGTTLTFETNAMTGLRATSFDIRNVAHLNLAEGTCTAPCTQRGFVS